MMNPHPRNRLRPALDTLEDRDVPTGWLSSAWPTVAVPVSAPVAVVAPRAPKPAPVPKAASTPAPVAPAAPKTVAPEIVSTSTVGTQMVAYLESHLGQRVGGGECAHLAVEALRTSGARFGWIGGSNTDYAWGTLLTTVVGHGTYASYSKAAARIQPGDVIQFTNARFSNGMYAPHHTAIVAAVDANGQVTAVYEQNFNGVRAVTKDALNLSQLISGHVKVYRPQSLPKAAGVFRFTIVNNAAGAVSVVERAGTASATYSLSKANTLASYQTRYWTTYGGVRLSIVVAGQSIPVTDTGEYEIYNGPTGVAIRKIG
jgi:hypothetical protein